MKIINDMLRGLNHFTSALIRRMNRFTGFVSDIHNHNKQLPETADPEKTAGQESLPANYNLIDLCPKLLETDMNRVFDELQEGDLVYAAMPFGNKRLASIEPSHRIRPYAVVKKTESGFIGYPLYSGIMGQNAKYSMKLSPEDYEVSRECRIVLEKASHVPKDHISNIIDWLSVSDQLRLNMIMNTAQLDEKKYPRFKVNTQLRINAVVNKDMNYYYIYSMEGKKASILPVTKEKTETPVNYCSELWYIDRTRKMNVILDDTYVSAGQLTRCVHNKLAQYYASRRRQEVKEAAKQMRWMEIPACAA